jgi:hypothetical protein
MLLNFPDDILAPLKELSNLLFTLDVKGKVAAGLILMMIGAGCEGLFTLYRYFLGRRLRRRVEDDHFTPAYIQDRVVDCHEPYIRPHCQDINPADQNSGAKRKRIFAEIDDLLRPPLPTRLTFILGDTGMGKTKFLDRYYARLWKSSRRCKRFKPVIIPLNSDIADDLIERISPDAQSRTLLLLDALDEDKAAIDNFPNRLAELVSLADRFYAIIITCRTQFLPVLEDKDQTANRLYLSLFSDWQVSRYIAKKFRIWWHPILRVRAEIATRRFRNLICRPLLLTYIQDIAPSSKNMKYSFQAYKVIVEKWLNREKSEKHTTIKPEILLCFSEDFAVRLFKNKQDRVSTDQLQNMADQCGFGLVPREVRVRSLLHNDSAGNWKFAHESIMEYLLVFMASEGKNRTPWSDRPWTAQMREFARDMLISGQYRQFPGADLRGEDLTGADLSGVDLRGTNLTGTNLVYAKMDFANVSGACLDGTILHGLNLTKVRGLTLPQAVAANSDQMTTWPMRILNEYVRDVYSLAISGDGRSVVTVSSGGTLKVWNLTDCRQLPPLLLYHDGYVNGVALSGDGSLAISASSDHSLKVWNLEQGRELVPPLKGHTDSARCVALSSDGELCVSVSSDHTLRVWNVRERSERIPPLECQSGNIATIAISSDGKLVMAVSYDETIDIWKLDERRNIKSKKIAFGVVRNLALNVDARLVVSASYDGILRVWDIESGQERLRLNGHARAVTGITVSEGGHLAVYDSENRTMQVWFPPDDPKISNIELGASNTMQIAV